MYFCPRGMPLYATLKYCPCGTNSFKKNFKLLGINMKPPKSLSRDILNKMEIEKYVILAKMEINIAITT